MPRNQLTVPRLQKRGCHVSAPASTTLQSRSRTTWEPFRCGVHLSRLSPRVGGVNKSERTSRTPASGGLMTAWRDQRSSSVHRSFACIFEGTFAVALPRHDERSRRLNVWDSYVQFQRRPERRGRSERNTIALLGFDTPIRWREAHPTPPLPSLARILLVATMPSASGCHRAPSPPATTLNSLHDDAGSAASR
jgi:hypothetical protein